MDINVSYSFLTRSGASDINKRNPELIDPKICKDKISNIYMILQIHIKYNIFIIYYIFAINKIINTFSI